MNMYKFQRHGINQGTLAITPPSYLAREMIPRTCTSVFTEFPTDLKRIPEQVIIITSKHVQQKGSSHNRGSGFASDIRRSFLLLDRTINPHEAQGSTVVY